jgi:hypothetical protein
VVCTGVESMAAANKLELILLLLPCWVNNESDTTAVGQDDGCYVVSANHNTKWKGRTEG